MMLDKDVAEWIKSVTIPLTELWIWAGGTNEKENEERMDATKLIQLVRDRVAELWHSLPIEVRR